MCIELTSGNPYLVCRCRDIVMKGSSFFFVPTFTEEATMVHVRLNTSAAKAIDGLHHVDEQVKVWLDSEAASWLGALPSVVEQRLGLLPLDSLVESTTPSGRNHSLPIGVIGSVELLCRRQLLLRRCLRGLDDVLDISSSRTTSCVHNLLSNVPLSVLSYSQYPQQHTLLISLELFQKLFVNRHFATLGEALRDLSRNSRADMDDVMTLIVCPARLPPDECRRVKNDRLVGISEVVCDRAYNKMVGEGSAIHRKVDKAISGRVAAADEAPTPQKETLAVFMRDVSIGLDMRLMTIAGGIVGYYLCRTRGMETGECIIGGAVGAVFMMFVDAVLLVIRLAKEDLFRRRRAAEPSSVVEGADAGR